MKISDIKKISIICVAKLGNDFNAHYKMKINVEDIFGIMRVIEQPVRSGEFYSYMNIAALLLKKELRICRGVVEPKDIIKKLRNNNVVIEAKFKELNNVVSVEQYNFS